MKFKQISILFTVMLVFSTFFSSFALAKGDPCHCSVVALGDSITAGYGLGANEKPFPNLITQPGNNTVTNLGVSGMTSGELYASLSNPQNASAIANADVVTLYIGGNDLINFIESLNLDSQTIDPNLLNDPTFLATLSGQAASIVPELRQNIIGTIDKINELNGDAPIILYNLYNPVNEQNNFYDLVDALVGNINSLTYNTISKDNVYLADAYTAFAGKQSKYVQNNEIESLNLGIHPTAAGHKALAQLADTILGQIFPPKEELDIFLTSTPEEITNGPVTISVQVHSGTVQSLKWLSGDKASEDFADQGTVIDTSSFQVTENGVYTVLAKDECGDVDIEKINITNIKKEDLKPNPDTNNTPDPAPNTGGSNNVTPTQTNTTAAPTTNTTSAPASTSTAAATTGNVLPVTATPIFNYMAAGLALVLAGMIALKVQHRRREDI
ncbi:SGNH/GDSL hydrolase family protein [Neobacillus sp. Marseille-QA0830]